MYAPKKLAAKACLLSIITGAVLIQVDGVWSQATETDSRPSSAVIHAAGDAKGGRIVPTSSLQAAAEKARLARTAAAKKSTKAAPAAGKVVPADKTAAASETADPSDVEQTAGVQQTHNAPQQQPQPGGPSNIERELEKLYRQNGREMPSMNMNEMPLQQTAPPNIPGTRHGPGSVLQSNNGPKVQPAKPNFIQRLFGRGSRSNQPAPNVAQPRSMPNQYQPRQAPQAAARPAMPQAAPQSPQYQNQNPQYQNQNPPQGYSNPPRTLQPMPTEQQPLVQVPQPVPVARQPQPSTTPPIRLPAPRPILDKEPFPYLDESPADPKSESLDLTEDDRPKVATEAPQILPSRVPQARPAAPAESPYSGLKIAPSEIEQKIAGDEPLGLDEELPAPPAVQRQPQTLQKPAAEKTPTLTEKTSTLEEPLPSLDDKPEEGQTETPRLVAPQGVTRRIPDDEPIGLDEQPEPETKEMEDTGKDEESLTIPEDDAAPRKIETEQPATPKAEPNLEREPQRLPVAKPAVGFKGYCPVVLKDDRKLIEAKAEFRSTHGGRQYQFSSAEAKAAFDEDPSRYIPAGGGSDVVKLASGSEDIDGTLEHAAWYRGRLYFFSSPETRSQFVNAPRKFMLAD